MKTLINYAASRPYYMKTIKASFYVLFSVSYKSYVASITIPTNNKHVFMFPLWDRR